MKLAKSFLIFLSALCAANAFAASFYFSRGIKNTSSTDLYSDTNNWCKNSTSDGWNSNPSNTVPGASDTVYLNYASGYVGNTWPSSRPAITLFENVNLGRFNITNNNNIPLTLNGPESTVTFNTKATSSTIIYKERNLGYFEFSTNIKVASTGLSNVTINNNSDEDLLFSGTNFTVESATVGATTVRAWVSFYVPQRSKPDQWTDYAQGDIIINSAINSQGSIEFRSDNVSSPRNSVGSIWLRGTKDNVIGWTHIKYGLTLYLDKSNGAQAISSSNGYMVYLGWRSHIVWMADNQIADNMTLQLKTPIVYTDSPSDLTTTLDLNGHSERVGQIEFWNDNSTKQGLMSVVDFGNGGEQHFTFKNFRIPTDTSFKNRVWLYRTFIEFRSYREGEDHVYCATKLSTQTYTNDDPNDKTTKNQINLLRFPEFGVYNVDYSISETAKTINGETLYEYAPVAK